MTIQFDNAAISHFVSATFGGLDGILIGRLLLALVLSGLVGLERSTHERASGLRTHILVGLGACLITVAGAYGFAELHTATSDRDPFRLATYVVSGIGFLGAGAIMRHGTTVRGLTTAASVWNVAGIGIAVGAGMGALAMLTVALILFVLGPLQKWEGRVRIGNTPSDLVIHLLDEGKAVGRTLARLASMGIAVRRATIVPGAGTSVVLRVELAVALRTQDVPGLVKQLMESPDVERVETTTGVRESPAGAADPNSDPNKAVMVRSRSEPARDLTRRKSKKTSPAKAEGTRREIGHDNIDDHEIDDALDSGHAGAHHDGLAASPGDQGPPGEP